MAPDIVVPPELSGIWGVISPYIDMVYPHLSDAIPTLTIMMLGIAIYGIIIFHFYRFVAKRDVFSLKSKSEAYKKSIEGSSGFWRAVLFFIEYGLAFPLIVFLWFGGFAIMLFLMAKNIPTEQTLLVAVVLVAGIRFTAYYADDLAKDLAKMIPFALLGIAIVDPNFFSLELFFERIESIWNFVPQIAAYFIFIIILEWVLRILAGIKRFVFGARFTTAVETEESE